MFQVQVHMGERIQVHGSPREDAMTPSLLPASVSVKEVVFDSAVSDIQVRCGQRVDAEGQRGNDAGGLSKWAVGKNHRKTIGQP